MRYMHGPNDNDLSALHRSDRSGQVQEGRALGQIWDSLFNGMKAFGIRLETRSQHGSGHLAIVLFHCFHHSLEEWHQMT